MNFIWDKITEWLKGLLVGGIVSNLSGLFDSINTRVADVASTVGIVAWDADVRHVDSDFNRFSLPPTSLFPSQSLIIILYRFNTWLSNIGNMFLRKSEIARDTCMGVNVNIGNIQCLTPIPDSNTPRA